jgi:hypothetical protein
MAFDATAPTKLNTFSKSETVIAIAANTRYRNTV